MHARVTMAHQPSEGSSGGPYRRRLCRLRRPRTPAARSRVKYPARELPCHSLLPEHLVVWFVGAHFIGDRPTELRVDGGVNLRWILPATIDGAGATSIRGACLSVFDVGFITRIHQEVPPVDTR